MKHGISARPANGTSPLPRELDRTIKQGDPFLSSPLPVSRARNHRNRHAAQHDCITLHRNQSNPPWTFKGPEGPITVMVSGAFCANNSEEVRQPALAGAGTAMHGDENPWLV